MKFKYELGIRHRGKEIQPIRAGQNSVACSRARPSVQTELKEFSKHVNMRQGW